MKNRISKLISYAKPFILSIIATIILSILVSITNAYPVKIMKNITDDVLIAKDLKKLQFVVIGIILLMLAKGVFNYYRIYLQNYISGKMVRNMRNELYEKVIYMSHDFFNKSKIGDLITRFISDLTMVQNVVTLSFELVVQLLTIIILLGNVFLLNWKLSIICLVLIPASSGIVRKYSKKLQNTGKGMQESFSKLNSLLQEILNGINIIKSFATEVYEIDRFREKNDENYRLTLKNVKVNARVRPLVEFTSTLGVAIIAYYGGLLVINGEMTPGELMSFLTSLGLISEPLKSVADKISAIQTRRHSINRVFEVLESNEFIKEQKHAKKLKKVKGKVSIKELWFKYNEKEDYVLKNINLDVNPGEMIALVGKSGSGKTTLVNLLPRFYDIKKGEILIDDVSIKDIKIESLRKNIGIVPQETFLFSGTIYDNISYGSIHKTTKKDIIKAAKMANAYNFIMEFPNGFDTEIGEKGVRLSGGQKQRIAIARALLENPPILILDEATSALDTESEKIVQDALDKLMENRTSFVIAHRLSTILSADKIVVMENGEVKEVGKKDELLAKNGIFKKLYDTQFKEVKEK
ncbi:ATP-binding cassette subfamily B protein/subfamily B ATP-binding cassette protein MsbA [Hypnocyclicus thermotrophus]|uniref:ATP-binding cassette subfamily B protein/subfamily B ATP-binding cassette protein MsbA n=1 Tax=Hypnocyclicus thermotrophus TaxID=1627895 RepID=A0AA46DYS9_9FUSO|nr:ABC transporter ATP-binding protein [Hypnocyclicus thermotrophus]TDT70618.1 ATP-binding cassette subfamily B protein/subfamily B ATP-binding cassette protein MsbA [Hypnocyclicus thermotrophus]